MTAKEISEKIFYSPATNGKAAGSIAEGEKMIKDYAQTILNKAAERGTAEMVKISRPEDTLATWQSQVNKQSITETPLH